MTEDEIQNLFVRIVAFEWDEDKRERNLRDHNVNFDDARQIKRSPLHCLWLPQRRRNRRDLHFPRSEVPPDLGAEGEA